MTRAILCASEHTDKILDKLEYNVGGIELIGCKTTSNLEKTINASGRLNKIIIFEKSIDGELPEIIKSSNYEVILVLNSVNLMQKYDIMFFGNKNIQIIDNKNKPITIPFIKEIVSATQIDDYLLYKSSNIEGETEEEYREENPVMETPKTEEREVEREVEEDEIKFIGNRETNEFDVPKKGN